MPKIKNVSPYGDLDVPLLGRVVAAGEVVEVSAAHAGKAPSGTPDTDGYDPGQGLLAQVDNWQPATKREGTP